MNPALIAAIAFAALFGASLLGIWLRRRLPDHHLSDETKDAVRIGMGSVATMAALVLGLLVASTYGAYDIEKKEVIQMAAKIIHLDQLLINCGPGATESREVLRGALRSAILRIWPAAKVEQGTPAPADAWTQALPRAIQGISTSDEAQRAFKLQAAALVNYLGQMRWLLFEQTESSISLPLLVIMVFWFTLTFVSVSLFAPPNATVHVAQLMAALSVAGAIFLILELDKPFSGLIQISSRPMVNALSHVAR
jgi:hypothetical protein